jgi:glycosyltransferase involved in cell wall biosynthesis
LIHARSYLPAAVAWGVWRVTGVPFIFDIRALWPEELITAGRLRRGSLIHRALERLGWICLRDAAGIVSQTGAAVEHLQARYPKELAGKRITVIPTCADLDRFRPPETPPEASIYGCVGTVLSGWFKTDWLTAFFRAVARHDPKARFEVVTRDDAESVHRQIEPDGTLDALSVFSANPEQMPLHVQRQTASAMFYAGGETSELGRSPTRMAEILGCGIPVVANEGVGDVARILRRYRVGVIARDCTDNAMDEAVRNLTELRTDPKLALRCRQAAEEVFSLAKGTEAYRSLYAEILGESGPYASSDAEDAS